MSAITPGRQATFYNGDSTISAAGSGINFINESTRSESATIGQGSSNNVVATSDLSDTIVARGFGQQVKAGAGQDTLLIENAQYGTFDAGAGNDSIQVRGSNYWSNIAGGTGYDTLSFDAPSSSFHVRDAGSHFDFVKLGGTITRVAKDVELVTFSDGNRFTLAELAERLANTGGALGAAVQGIPTAAVAASLQAGALQQGSQLDDRITLSSVTTVDSGAGDDTIVDTRGFWNHINAGAGNDTVNAAGDWGSRTDLGEGNDRLNLGLYGGAGRHDGGAGEDMVRLDGTNFIIQKHGHDDFRIQRDGAAGSNFVSFERFELGGRTYTSAELTAAIDQASGRLVVGTDRNVNGTDRGETLTLDNGQFASVAAGDGDDVINMSGYEVFGDGGAGNDIFNLRNTRSSWNRILASGGEGDDRFNVDDSANQAASNLLRIDGGNGNDIATFTRNASEYHLTDVTGSTATLTHIESGATTKITNVERLVFGAGTHYSLAELQGLFNDAQTWRGIQSVRLQDASTATQSGWHENPSATATTSSSWNGSASAAPAMPSAWNRGAPTPEIVAILAAGGLSVATIRRDNEVYWHAVRLADSGPMWGVDGRSSSRGA